VSNVATVNSPTGEKGPSADRTYHYPEQRGPSVRRAQGWSGRAHQAAGGSGDGAGVDAGPGQQLLPRPRARHATDSKVSKPQIGTSGSDQRVGDGGALPALGVVVLGDDVTAVGERCKT
jgi:hypothetical protein